MFKFIKHLFNFAGRAHATSFRHAAELVDSDQEYFCCHGISKADGKWRNYPTPAVRFFERLFDCGYRTFGTQLGVIDLPGNPVPEHQRIRVLALLLAAEIAEHGDFVEDVAK